jgi:hypothetical protein
MTRRNGHVTVEINGRWTFSAATLHKTTPLCLNLKAHARRVDEIWR